MIEKEFIPYEQALDLKELGFDEPCLFLYNSTDDEPKPFLASPPEAMDWNTLYIEKTNKHLMSAPTYSQAFRWFRKKYNLHYPIQIQGNLWFFEKWSLNGFKTYEEVELACLRKLIETIKNK